MTGRKVLVLDDRTEVIYSPTLALSLYAILTYLNHAVVDMFGQDAELGDRYGY